VSILKRRIYKKRFAKSKGHWEAQTTGCDTKNLCKGEGDWRYSKNGGKKPGKSPWFWDQLRDDAQKRSLENDGRKGLEGYYHSKGHGTKVSKRPPLRRTVSNMRSLKLGKHQGSHYNGGGGGRIA